MLHRVRHGEPCKILYEETTAFRIRALRHKARLSHACEDLDVPAETRREALTRERLGFALEMCEYPRITTLSVTLATGSERSIGFFSTPEHGPVLRIVVGRTWLTRVWRTGFAVIDGSLVLDILEPGPEPLVIAGRGAPQWLRTARGRVGTGGRIAWTGR